MKYYLGIDLGGTNIAAGVTDEQGNIINKFSRKTNANVMNFGRLVSHIAATAKETVSLSGLCAECITAVGMGTPSCINPSNGLLVNANNLGWKNVPLQSEVQKHFNVPVYIQNDAACAALGEAVKGSAAGYDSALMVTLGTGVGGGIILNGRIFNGCDSMGAEIGHTKLVSGGLPCTCGQKGCFEAYASASALTEQACIAAKEFPESVMNEMCGNELSEMNAQIPFKAAKAGDRAAAEVIERYIYYLASGLSSLTAVFRPQVIVIGGGISGQGNYLIEPLRKKLYGLTFSAEQIGIPEVVCASLGNDAGIIGAAMLCANTENETEEKIIC